MMLYQPSLRAQAKQSKSGKSSLDCFVALLLAMTRKARSLPPRPFQQQGVEAAGSGAPPPPPRARLAAGTHFRDIDPRRQQPCPRRVDVGDPPAQSPQFVVG